MPKFKTQEQAHETHRHYDIDTDLEGKYDISNPYNSNKLRIDFIVGNIPKESHVLEVGCNSGGLLKAISKLNGSYCNGVDISQQMVLKAIAKGFSCKLGSAEELPYPERKFDVVIMTEVLEHIYNVPKALVEAYRVLKKDGLFIGTVPHNKSYNSNRMELEQHRWHCHKFNRKTLTKELVKYFHIEQLKDIAWYNDLEQKPQWIGWICKKQ